MRGFVRVLVGSLCVDGLCFVRVFVCSLCVHGAVLFYFFNVVRWVHACDIRRASAVLCVSLSVPCASIGPSWLTDLCAWYCFSRLRGFVRVLVGSLCVDGLGFVFVCFVFHLVRLIYVFGIRRAVVVLCVCLCRFVVCRWPRFFLFRFFLWYCFSCFLFAARLAISDGR
jgi:hypothetical protein